MLTSPLQCIALLSRDLRYGCGTEFKDNQLCELGRYSIQPVFTGGVGTRILPRMVICPKEHSGLCPSEERSSVRLIGRTTLVDA